jgi:hypothetical protein
MVSSAGVVIVLEAEAHRCGIAFDRRQRFEHEIAQERRLV